MHGSPNWGLLEMLELRLVPFQIIPKNAPNSTKPFTREDHSVRMEVEFRKAEKSVKRLRFKIGLS